MNTEIIVAIITGSFGLLGGVVRELVRYWLESRKVGQGFQKPPNWRTPARLTLFGITIGYVIGLIFRPIPPPPPPPTPTPIPRGDLIMEINFNQSGDGDCNEYEDALLGYELSQYYILPKPNGYIAICHKIRNLASQGSLEVNARLDGEIRDIYGFGLLFGWKGHGTVTTDACIVGIRRSGAVTQAFYSIRQSGERQVDTRDLQSVELDNARHVLRVVLFPDGKAYGYLDERLFGVYEFEHCGSGSVGMLAWGPGEQKIYFDDLKLFSLP